MATDSPVGKGEELEIDAILEKMENSQQVSYVAMYIHLYPKSKQVSHYDYYVVFGLV